jgi:rubredoxin
MPKKQAIWAKYAPFERYLHANMRERDDIRMTAPPHGWRRRRGLCTICAGILMESGKSLHMEYKTWMCLICGWIYDEATGSPEDGIAPGTKWEDVPINWTCPECGARKEDFEMVAI